MAYAARIKALIFLLSVTSYQVTCICTQSNNETCLVEGNATFSEDFVTIRIDFTLAVKPLVPYYNCSGIVDAEVLSALGSRPICAFTKARSLEIYPDKDGTIKPGAVLVFERNSIGNANDTVLDMNNITVEIFPGPKTFEPEVILTESGYQANCPLDKYYVSGDYSKNSGFSHLVDYVWGLDVMVDNTSAGALIAANSALKSRPSNDSEVEITDTIVAANQSILLKANNVFGDNGNSTIGLTSPNSPVARILGEKKIALYSSQELRLVSELGITKCGPAMKSVTYMWNISKTAQSQAYHVANLANESKVLTIPRNALQGGLQFTVTVIMTYTLSNNQTGVLSDFVVVDVKKPPLGAQIVGCNREVGKNQNLVLKAKHQLDAKELVGYQWSCKHAVSGEICKLSNGTSDFSFGNTSTISVSMAAGNFTPGNRYQFTLEVTRGAETASASIVVTVTQSSVPLVAVMPHRAVWSYDEKMTVRGVVYGVNASLTYKWMVHGLFGEEMKALSLTGSASRDINNAIAPVDIILPIPMNLLSPEQTYKLSLAVTAGNTTSQCSVMQRISMPPRHGYFSVMPLQGNAYNTTFRFRTHAWIDRQDRQPFQFRFGYKSEKLNTRLYLTTWKNHNGAPEIILPSDNSTASNEITVFAEVRNSLGLSARRELVIQLESQQTADQDGLVKYFQEMANIGEHDSMTTAVIGLLKSGLNIESKRTYLSEYFQVIEKSFFLSDTALIFIDALWEMSLLDAEWSQINGSNAVFTTPMKAKVVALLEKLFGYLDLKDDRFKITMTQADRFSKIIENMMPEAQSLSASDAPMLNSFKSAAKHLARLSCKSIQFNENPIKVNNSVMVLSTGMSTKPLSLSKPYRERFFQTKCSELNYMNCAGICLSVTSFKKLKYFMLDGEISGLVTEVHEAALTDLTNIQNVDFGFTENDLFFNLPVVQTYNKTSFDLQCLMQDPQTKTWVRNHCSTASITIDSGMEILHCKCSKMLPVVGVTVAKSSLTSTAKATTNAEQSINATTGTDATNTPVATTMPPPEVVTVVLNGNCTKYLQSDVKQNFTESLTTSLAVQLSIDKTRIRIISLTCGSIIVNITIKEKPASASEPTSSAAIMNLKGLLSSGLMRITLYDGVLAAVAPGVNISFPPTIPPMTTKKVNIPEFKTNWMPLIVSFLLVLAFIILVSALVAWMHGRYYKKKHYTDINCDRKKPKVPTQKVLNKKQKMKKFETIMEESLENHTSAMATGSTSTMNKRLKKKSRVGAMASLALPMTTNILMNRDVFLANQHVREVPRLALDDSSSESEGETSFSTANDNGKSSNEEDHNQR